MLEFLSKLFDTTGFPPRWHCGNWTEGHGWLHIVSDLAVFGAYAAIPISIASYILVKKQEVAFRKLYWLFAGFILSCGFTHLIDASLFWHPWYRLSGTVKLITAIASWATVIALIRALPVAMRLPGTAKLADRLMEEVEERKRSENALRDSSTRLSLAMEHSRLGDWSWDAATDLCHLSPRAAEMIGYAPDSTVTWEDIIGRMHSEDRIGARQSMRRAIIEHADYDDEYRVTRADQNEVWISARGRAQYDDEGRVTGMIGTFANITERKLADRERERLLANESAARNEAERANRMKDEFLATLSHELRTPLNAILGWSNMLRKDHANEDDLNTGLEVIERNTLVQARLIEDLLDMSRIISGKIRLDVQSTDLKRVVEAAIDAVRPSAESRKIRLISVLDPLAGPVRGDPARLQQIVWNLLTNAIKFTPQGGKVEVALERVNSHVEITVSDTGVGIEPEFLPYVFDRFRQGDSSITRKHGGLGLGLSIVKNLTEMHGGTVHAKSAGHGHGASFRVALPMPVAHPDARSHEDRAHPTGDGSPDKGDNIRPDLSGSRILIVDDESDCLGLVRRILEAQGAEVTAATRAEEALQHLRQGGYHALVSDIGMPEMDGYELIRRIRQMPVSEGGHIPAIALTAFARSEDRRRAMTAGFDMFISKPVDPAELLAVVMRAVARGKPVPGAS
jgi:PAS domain S-box-containing protein